jgi:hypothetical protein
VELREATADDAGVLLDTLVEACNWWGEQRGARSDVDRHPQRKHYVSTWPQGDDFGVVALDDDGAAVGAAWVRRFLAHDPGYGFGAPDVPELSMAVVAGRRGHGIGRRCSNRSSTLRVRAAGAP